MLSMPEKFKATLLQISTNNNYFESTNQKNIYNIPQHQLCQQLYFTFD